VRAGLVRQLMAGAWSLLPVAYRVRQKIRRIIEEEIDAIGGQQFLLPALHPAEVWRKSGRWDKVGPELFRFKDRRDADIALGMTHEEVFASVAAELTSYKQLPQLWYQIQTKFRDEPRPKAGLLRVREFTMKDSYSLDIDAAGLDAQFEHHRQAYTNIFTRIGVVPIAVEASSGMMGGAGSVEFMVRSEAGEDLVAHCDNCGYAANVEKATSRVPTVDDGTPPDAPRKFPTPGIRTIAALADAGHPADRQLKSLVYIVEGEPVIVVLRGDHPLQEQKLADALGVTDLRPADADEIHALLGAHPGSLGPVGVEHLKVVADRALEGRTNMTTGANEDDFHLEGVDVDRDLHVAEWHDLREVRAGEPCTTCGEPLDVFKAIEVGHIFKLGTDYAKAMGATIVDENGVSHPIVMGSYGIGLERNLAAVVEQNHDEKGIVWPVAVAPWEVVITVVKIDDQQTIEAAEMLYLALGEMGIDVIIDDRDERPGVKFTDAELVGIPYRITVGPRGLADGNVEVTHRGSGESTVVRLETAAKGVAEQVLAAR
jgi:prolyl-tRNA synthetase